MGETKKKTDREKLISKLERSLNKGEALRMIDEATSLRDVVEFLLELYSVKELEEAIRG